MTDIVHVSKQLSCPDYIHSKRTRILAEYLQLFGERKRHERVYFARHTLRLAQRRTKQAHTCQHMYIFFAHLSPVGTVYSCCCCSCCCCCGIAAATRRIVGSVRLAATTTTINIQKEELLDVERWSDVYRRRNRYIGFSCCNLLWHKRTTEIQRVRASSRMWLGARVILCMIE